MNEHVFSRRQSQGGNAHHKDSEVFRSVTRSPCLAWGPFGLFHACCTLLAVSPGEPRSTSRSKSSDAWELDMGVMEGR